MTEPILSIRNLAVDIPTRYGLFQPVRNVS